MFLQYTFNSINTGLILKYGAIWIKTKGILRELNVFSWN